MEKITFYLPYFCKLWDRTLPPPPQDIFLGISNTGTLFLLPEFPDKIVPDNHPQTCDNRQPGRGIRCGSTSRPTSERYRSTTYNRQAGQSQCSSYKPRPLELKTWG